MEAKHFSPVPENMTGNPVLPGWYADPELHLFGDRYYIYPTHSVAFDEQTWFDVWSSRDLKHWNREGVILDFADVPWSTNRCAWAPSCIERNGQYFFYFSAGDGAGLGVAVADNPTGPFRDALGRPLIGHYHQKAQPIDAHAFIDDDGQAYLYYGGHSRAVVVKLGEDMISLDGDFHMVTPENYVEGPFMLKHKGRYYFMWSEGGWGDSSYRVAYAISDSPLGPFVREGIILQSDAKVGNGAGHHSVLNFPGTDEWVICYHRRPIEETHHNNRVTCLDVMEFDEHDRIKPIVLTHSGVAIRPLS